VTTAELAFVYHQALRAIARGDTGGLEWRLKPHELAAEALVAGGHLNLDEAAGTCEPWREPGTTLRGSWRVPADA
jgi:hypothetical protein